MNLTARREAYRAILEGDKCVHPGSVFDAISARIAEDAFDFLDAPVMRVGALDTPIPFAKNLEEQYLPGSRLLDKLQALLTY